jgi:hypothetical protein
MSFSLSSAKGFVTDALRIAPAVFYEPENVVLGQYAFVPWVRSGLAAAIQSATAAALRGTVSVGVTVQDTTGTTRDVAKTLVLRGPGDVVGIDPGQIIRRVPQPGTVNAEESFVAQIEFDRPEYPWLFSPFAPDGERLRPWLALVVCEASRAELRPGSPGLPQQLATTLGELPLLDDAWAWAHAQVVGPADGAGASVADRLTDDHAPANLSRLLCPRKLDRNKNYIACLVPAFDAGVRAGLGQSAGTLAHAWTRAADGSDAGQQIVLPCYDSWSFSIADAGDFRSLAERLVPIAAPWPIGRRLIDASAPRGTLPPLADGAPGAVQVLRCALVSPQPMPADGPQEGAGWNATTRDALRQVVDTANAPGHEDLPRVGPRLYARFQRARSTIGPVFGAPADDARVHAADADWFAQLNSHPMHRVVAGLGTRVVQRDQEPLMQAAWAQVGDIDAANRALRQHQFGRYVGDSLHKMHFSRLDLGTLSQVLRGVQGKLRLNGAGLTLHGQVEASAVAPAAMTAAFRRATRTRGPVARQTGTAASASLRQLVAKGDQFRDFRRPYSEPDGVRSLSARAIAALPTALVARKLGINEAAAGAALSQRLVTLANTRSIADVALSPVAGWRVPTGNLDFGAIAAGQVAQIVEAASPASVQAAPLKSEIFASVFVGLANSRVAGVAERADQHVLDVHQRLPLQLAPALPVVPNNIGLRALGVAPQIARVPQAAAGRRIPIDPRLPPVTLPPVTLPPAPLPPAAVAEQRFETDVSRGLTDIIARARAIPALTAAQAVSDLALGAGIQALPLTPARPALAAKAAALLLATAPARTMSQYAQARLARFPEWLAPDWFANGRVEPIMAAPHFDRPMYEALDAYSRDWLIPGLGTIASTDFVTLLETNPAFTEAFLIGLSDEMGRELLWRGYPTDQRGTYFRRFWDHDKDELAADIHLFDPPPFAARPLGSHLNNDGGEHGHLVLVVRGELVRRYPHAMMTAVLAEADDDQRPVFSTHTAEIQFHAHLPPDIVLVGFRLTAEQVRRDPWWFILSEHPTAPRFGLELAGRNPRVAGATVTRDDADWNDLTDGSGRLDQGRFLSPRGRTITVSDPLSTPPSTIWPGSAATVARTLLRNPVRAAFRGHTLVTPQPGAPNA